MDRKQRLFIYDRKEIFLLLLLGVMVAAFAFTLGVHLGKHVQSRTESEAHPSTPVVETAPDAVPNRQELSEQSKTIGESADQALEQATEEEVANSGVALDVPKPLELPKEAKSAKGGATTLSESEPKETSDELKGPDHPAAHRAAPSERYTLQVGSYRSVEEAGEKIARMEKQGLKPYLRSVILKGKGQWYRVYVGGYDSKEAADRAGRQFQRKKLIDSYIVSNRIE